MPPVTIHGNTINPEPLPDGSPSPHTSRDAANTNYIYVQGEGHLDDAQKIQLRDLGAHVHRYEGDNTYLCRFQPSDLEPLRSLPFVRHANAYHRAFKTTRHLKEILQHQSEATVAIGLHEGADTTADVAAEIAGIHGVQTNSITVTPEQIVARISPQALPQLEQLDAVKVIELRPNSVLHNDTARNILGANQPLTVQVGGKKIFTGNGQAVTVADTGFDKGSTDPATMHPAFKSVSVKLLPVSRAGKTNDPDGHGTHVCGSVLGSGTSKAVDGTTSFHVQGTAPGASLVVQSILGETGFDPPTDLPGRLFEPAFKLGSRIHTNSWGYNFNAVNGAVDGQNPYDLQATSIDKFVHEHPEFVILFSAGNDGGATFVRLKKPGDWSSYEIVRSKAQVGSTAAAKNCITVGLSESSRKSDGLKYDPTRSSSNDTAAVDRISSIGPTTNGRTKPDIVAPGSAILSAASQDPGFPVGKYDEDLGVSKDRQWAFLTGTSMATPLVAGCVALIREALLSTSYSTAPSAALVKALLIHYASDMSGNHLVAQATGSSLAVTYTTAPSANYGYGRVNVDAALQAIVTRSSSDTTRGFDDKQTLQATKTSSYTITKPTGLSTLKVTLVYSDREGAVIQNYLSLLVTAVGVVGSRSGKNANDPENNVAQVVWSGFTGTGATINVHAERIAQTGDSQGFAVVWSWS